MSLESSISVEMLSRTTIELMTLDYTIDGYPDPKIGPQAFWITPQFAMTVASSLQTFESYASASTGIVAINTIFDLAIFRVRPSEHPELPTPSVDEELRGTPFRSFEKSFYHNDRPSDKSVITGTCTVRQQPRAGLWVTGDVELIDVKCDKPHRGWFAPALPVLKPGAPIYTEKGLVGIVRGDCSVLRITSSVLAWMREVQAREADPRK